MGKRARGKLEGNDENGKENNESKSNPAFSKYPPMELKPQAWVFRFLSTLLCEMTIVPSSSHYIYDFWINDVIQTQNFFWVKNSSPICGSDF